MKQGEVSEAELCGLGSKGKIDGSASFFEWLY